MFVPDFINAYELFLLFFIF